MLAFPKAVNVMGDHKGLCEPTTADYIVLYTVRRSFRRDIAAGDSLSW